MNFNSTKYISLEFFYCACEYKTYKIPQFTTDTLPIYNPPSKNLIFLIRESLQKVARKEEHKEKEQATVDEHRLLPGRERVPSEPELLVLREAGDLDALALEERLRRPARRAPPVLRQLPELQPRRNGVRGVAGGLVVAVPTRPALVDSGVEDGEPLLEPPAVEFRLLFFGGGVGGRRGRRRLGFFGDGLVVFGDVDGGGEELGSWGFEEGGVFGAEEGFGFGGRWVLGLGGEEVEGEVGSCSCRKSHGFFLLFFYFSDGVWCVRNDFTWGFLFQLIWIRWMWNV